MSMPSSIPIAYSGRFLYKLPAGHRFPIGKYQLIADQLVHEGIVDPGDFHDAGLCSDETILTTHDPEYWQRVRDFALNDKELRRLGLPLNENSLNRARNSLAGTIWMSERALERGVGFNIGGGTHHAFYDRGEAFSVLNDIAIAAKVLLGKERVSRVLIVDLDVHQGNGTASLFRADPRVTTFSVHGRANYPFRKEVSDLDIALDPGTADDQYLDTLERRLMPLLRELGPDLILYQAGVDVMKGDRLGSLALSKAGIRERDRMVFEGAQSQGIPIGVTLGGGYADRLADIVNAHVSTIRQAVERLG